MLRRPKMANLAPAVWAAFPVVVVASPRAICWRVRMVFAAAVVRAAVR
jgi:hypothetical protein